MKKFSILLLFLVLFVTNGQAFIQRDTVISTVVYFPKNSHSPFLNDNYYKFTQQMVPYLRENKECVKNVLFLGSASPEGNPVANEKLSNSRAYEMYSYVSEFIPLEKITVRNDNVLFKEKTTGNIEPTYEQLRATYIEISLSKTKAEPEPVKHDTVYVEYETKVTDTVYVNNCAGHHLKLNVNGAFTADLLQTMLLHPKVGLELGIGNVLAFSDAGISWFTFNNTKYKIVDVNVGLKEYLGKYGNGLYLEEFWTYSIFDLAYGEFSKKGSGYGVGAGIGFSLPLSGKTTISPYVRGGWFRYSSEKIVVNKYTSPTTTLVYQYPVFSYNDYFGLFICGIKLNCKL